MSLWTACKNGERSGKRSETETDVPKGDAPLLRDVPYLVHVHVALEGETPVVTLQDVKTPLVGACLGCHGAGTVLDLSEFPFKGRFATPQETVQEMVARMRGTTAPMPPAPASRLPEEQIALVEQWLKAGLPLAQPARDAPPFAQGLVLTVRYRISAAADWSEASLPWNGSGDFPGFFRQLAPGQTVDVVLLAAAEDGTQIATQSMQALSMPASGNIEFSLGVDEKTIKTHASDKAAALPGGDGLVVARGVAERSLSIHWDPAADLLTTGSELRYAVYVADHGPFDTLEVILADGRQVSDFAPYQELLQITGLEQGKPYFVAVLVKDKGGNVALYKILEQATAADTTPPGVPTPAKITVSQLSDVAVTLSWKAASDNLTPASDLSYQVYSSFQNVTGDPASGVIENRISTTLHGLVPETTYYFDVMVQDEAGNQSWYERVQVKSRAGSGSIGVTSYGRQCAERLGELRPFSCLDGQIIPIVVNGTEIPAGLTAQQAQSYQWGTGANQMACDKPALLGLGDQGRCVPYSRVGRLKTFRSDGTEHPDVDTMFTCRRYQTRLGPQTYQGKTYDGADLPLFEDIAILQHNRVTGESCWYQMLRPNYASTDGRRIPPPNEAELPAGSPSFAQTAAQFWLSPQSAADKKCFRCHDADPWMHSPYIDQVRDDAGLPIVPPGGFGGGRSGKYSMLGSRAFYKWDKSLAIASTVTTDTNGKSCTSCHNVGSFNGCLAWSKQASGLQLAPNLSAAGQAFALKYWMPPAGGDVHSLADWQSSGFQRAAERLAACCANPDQSECSKTPIMTPPPPHE